MNKEDIHSYFQKYINGGCLKASDKMLYLFSPEHVFRKNASWIGKKMVSYREIAEPASVLRFQVEIYKGVNKQVRDLIYFLEKNLKNDLIGAYVHGSNGTGEEIGYSDLDALVILKDEVLDDENRLGAVASRLNEARRFMLQMDPLQHHGWFVLAESDLKNYPDAWFPSELFPHVKSLFTDRGLELTIHIDRNRQDYSAPLKKLCHSIEKKIRNQRPATMYQLKNLLSEFMLLPALYLQTRDQKGVFKKFSFEAAQKDFSSEEWSIMNEVSLIRLQWSLQLAGWKKNMMESPRYFSLNLSAMLSPKIPAGISDKLDGKFYQSMLDFTKMMTNRIQ